MEEGLAVLGNEHVNPPRACVHNKNNTDVFIDTFLRRRVDMKKTQLMFGWPTDKDS